MDPRTQGQFVHEVFEAFFKRWQDEGHQAITPDTIDLARAVFRDVVEKCLERLSDTEAALERTRLLGSPAAAGLGEAVLRMEAERPVPVVARLLEHRLKGDFAFDTAAGQRRLSLSGKADRIDLLADGTFRLIDYKLGWPPNKARALQLPIYGICAEQSLDGHLRPALDPRRGGLPRVQGSEARGGAVLVACTNGPRSLQTRSSGWPTRSTQSRPASFPRHQTMCIAARPARTPQCAERTTSVMSDGRLPFDDGWRT